MDLELRAAKLLVKNRKLGFCNKHKLKYSFTAPSNTTYPFQWFWDSSFHAIVLSRFDADFAKLEITSILQHQAEDGFIPHVVFWRDVEIPRWGAIERHPKNPDITAMVQPPVLALAVARTFEATRDKRFLKQVLPKVSKFHKYLLEKRDPDEDFLVSIIQSRESGLDFSPQYDRLFGNPKNYTEAIESSDRIFLTYQLFNWDLDKIFKKDLFVVEDILVNVLLVKALEQESNLWNVLGDARAAKTAKVLSKKIERAIITKLWHPKRKTFFSLYGADERYLSVKTVSSLLPLWLDLPDSYERELIKQLTDPRQFWPEHPVPSVALSEPSYRETGTPWIWRGPTWINTNWMLYRALSEAGHRKLANIIAKKSRELVRLSGFREFYNPRTGMGMGAKDFAWSTLVTDMNVNAGSE